MKKLKKCFFDCCCALWYVNAFTFNHYFYICNSRAQGHLMTLAKGHMSVVCHFQRASPLKLLDQFHFNFKGSLQAMRERKFINFVKIT